ncbi:SDR family NAD(P)-dependent oxidoreductase [Nocardia goodfellowii]|uniref:NAD(P)-dependent dehydrogenase (Short-subunit alcohol dehydrogenase family) n=1 Tax=Nocardia goodfellowii TaxID=882446 RepID=A0ABS4QQX6_9NOCA|nr:SDR family NAD(P)-dependent oxidoreductase [Nocardia goodfellowii]MBP2194107.1 NAD(P)-dependent dehydrogenase (short-subunit alcohol dehydrogenase family) [Nocardia goodfellowii]
MFGLEKLIPVAVRPRRSYGARAVVTGAGSGIGRAFALEIAARGGQVICADIDEARADDTVALIEREHPGTAHAFRCDVAQREDVQNLARFAASIFDGPASLVINNAGVGIGGKHVGDIGFEDWNWALGINLWGVVHGCEVFTPQLRASRERPRGIINVASAAGFAAAPSMAAYNTAKAAVMSLSETMAAELNKTGVGVTVLCPTFVKTNVARDGRITGEATRLAETLMRITGFTPDQVAKTTLDAHDRGQLYVLPQWDAHVVWRLKRYFPAQYTLVLGLLERLLPQDTSPSPDQITVTDKTGV